ncbi:putative Laccase [Glarea lozoyensis 74030]|uniref:laccase n=1 Tax=Glarea lozoyensis (strain ATCC 74030 / MF5533) TaxID=1104152 RepID=H0EWH4_GLAL7|nr:putative Laccase [Glarea lozoyensis 74030]
MNGALPPFNANTDSETQWPVTGVEKFYDLHISKKTLSPDGNAKEMLVINGQYPGTLIQAQWGDRLTITVYNDMTDNGTSMHWHGIIQANSTTQDGVNGITECPIAPGKSRRYSFIATQHGTTWYHSHYSGQYGDGIVGTMIIYGPATANYDEDLGTFPITDWYKRNVYQLGIASEAGAPPTADTSLINGTMKVGTVGSYSKTNMVKGKKYRLRLINTSVDNMYQVSLDGHDFEVVAADFVPIKPYNTTWLFIGIGQRSELDVEWSHPTVKYVFDNQISLLAATPNNTIGKNVINLGEGNKWHFFAIQNLFGLPHPIHLHGHDFYILGQFGSQFTEAMVPQLNFIAWHVAQGLGLQFIERPSLISRPALQAVDNECKVWDAWYNTTPFKKFDSGLRKEKRDALMGMVLEGVYLLFFMVLGKKVVWWDRWGKGGMA